MTIHLTTVGKTITDWMTDPKTTAECPALHELIDKDGQLQDAQELGVNRADTQSIRDLLCRFDDSDKETVRELWQRTGVMTWPSTASAETTSLNAINSHRTYTVADADVVILLASDTADGLLAALWNAAVMTAGDPGHLRYLDAPGGVLQQRGEVVLTRVPDLDLAQPSKLPDAMEHLGRLGRVVLDSLKPAEPVRVHLSGGYKATLPFLLGISEGMQSVPLTRPGFDNRPADVRATAVHVDSLSSKDHVIPVPLRRLTPETVRRTLRAVGQGEMPANNSLEGYAYKLDDTGVPALTAFGRGLKALFGEPPVVP